MLIFVAIQWPRATWWIDSCMYVCVCVSVFECVYAVMISLPFACTTFQRDTLGMVRATCEKLLSKLNREKRANPSNAYVKGRVGLAPMHANDQFFKRQQIKLGRIAPRHSNQMVSHKEVLAVSVKACHVIPKRTDRKSGQTLNFTSSTSYGTQSTYWPILLLRLPFGNPTRVKFRRNIINRSTLAHWLPLDSVELLVT